MEKLNSLVPLFHVKSVPRSIEFYKKLGFEVGATHVPEGESEPVWAWLRSGGAHLMVNVANEPVDPEQQAVIYYIYCADVKTFREEFIKNGVECSEITYPFYCPKGEFRVTDPDGWCLMVTHAGD